MLKLPIVVLDHQRIEEIADACPLTKAGDRDSDLITFLFGTGLRISEALGLRKEDVNFERNTIVVRRGKNGKTRTVAASKDAMDAIKDYWVAAKPGQPVWGITPSAVRKRFRLLAKRLGIPRLHAHSLRHAHAVELVRKNVPINFIQQQLGHSNIGTTSLYLERYNPSERVMAILAAFGG